RGLSPRSRAAPFGTRRTTSAKPPVQSSIDAWILHLKTDHPDPRIHFPRLLWLAEAVPEIGEPFDGLAGQFGRTSFAPRVGAGDVRQTLDPQRDDFQHDPAGRPRHHVRRPPTMCAVAVCI